ncbi:hypothetical protein MKW98_032502 [Papaver atlanticum]|uniref:Uncharacterized protein n=1 Tax=Papaver atlanticum TaxID=357466 RepID=A0AAD4SVK8_9MAGN|nr:hypothetical protein MKW98_032502 [Papaver atlanticum]
MSVESGDMVSLLDQDIYRCQLPYCISFVSDTLNWCLILYKTTNPSSVSHYCDNHLIGCSGVVDAQMKDGARHLELNMIGVQCSTKRQHTCFTTIRCSSAKADK